MIKVGITGGIGAGKSVVAQILKALGYPVYIADTEAKRLMGESPVIRRSLISYLGTEAFDGEQLNRPFIARAIFHDKCLLKKINSLVHPEVRNDFHRWTRVFPEPAILFLESAILYEADFQKELDAIIYVSAPLEVRIKRVMERDSCSRNDVEQRIAAQQTEEKEAEKADFTILNDERNPLIPQVAFILNQLKHQIFLSCC